MTILKKRFSMTILKKVFYDDLKKRFSMTILKLFLLTSMLMAFNSYAVPVDLNVLVESANKPVANANVKLMAGNPKPTIEGYSKGPQFIRRQHQLYRSTKVGKRFLLPRSRRRRNQVVSKSALFD